MRHASAPARLLRQVLVVLSGMAVAGLVSVGPAAPPAAAQTAASVTVNATSGLGTIPADAIGLNTAVYDGYMNDTPIPGLLKAAGIDALRYPGGSYSDIYNWQNGTAAAGGYVAPNTAFSSFMTTAKAVGAQPIITVNYGTGTPSLAAAWVPARCPTVTASSTGRSATRSTATARTGPTGRRTRTATPRRRAAR